MCATSRHLDVCVRHACATYQYVQVYTYIASRPHKAREHTQEQHNSHSKTCCTQERTNNPRPDKSDCGVVAAAWPALLVPYVNKCHGCVTDTLKHKTTPVRCSRLRCSCMACEHLKARPCCLSTMDSLRASSSDRASWIIKHRDWNGF
jgi:hypothetical protein